MNATQWRGRAGSPLHAVSFASVFNELRGIIISPVAVVISACDFETAVRAARLFCRWPGKVRHHVVSGIARQSSRTACIAGGNSLFPHGPDQICAPGAPGAV